MPDEPLLAPAEQGRPSCGGPCKSGGIFTDGASAEHSGSRHSGRYGRPSGFTSRSTVIVDAPGEHLSLTTAHVVAGLSWAHRACVAPGRLGNCAVYDDASMSKSLQVVFAVIGGVVAVAALLAATGYFLSSQGYRVDLGGDDPSSASDGLPAEAHPDCVTYEDQGKLSPTGDGNDCDRSLEQRAAAPDQETGAEASELDPSQLGQIEDCGEIDLPDSNRGDEYLNLQVSENLGCDAAKAAFGDALIDGETPPHYDCQGNTHLTCTLGDNTVIVGHSYR